MIGNRDGSITIVKLLIGIDPESIQDRGVEIRNRNRTLHHFVPEIIRHPDGLSGF